MASPSSPTVNNTQAVTFSSFFNSALPNQLSFLQASAGYNGSNSAFTPMTWNYSAAISPQLLATTEATASAQQSAGLQTIADLGAAEFGSLTNTFNNWANSQNSFVASINNALNTSINKSAKASGSIFGAIF